MLYGSLAELYDRIYDWKDYRAEVEKISALLEAEGVPNGAPLLDAACGTGTHLALFAERYDVAGFDKSAEMLAVARKKLGPSVSLFQSDMRDLVVDEPRRALVCLFSSIGYLLTDEDIERAARAFASALAPGGVVVIEPWHRKAGITDGHISVHTHQGGDILISRQGFTRVEGENALLHMEWLIAREKIGIEHASELHVMRLIEPERLVAIFERAGFDARFTEDGLMPKRGLVVGRKR